MHGHGGSRGDGDYEVQGKRMQVAGSEAPAVSEIMPQVNDVPTPTASASPEAEDRLFVDRGELAHRLDVHPRTVRRMVNRGELPKPCLSASGRPRWLWAHVVAYCQKRHLREEDLDRRRNRKLK
ncbi:MAG: hypothetical protein KJ749_13715 [Planctomycetes bacterium]|nr:hypothetical protein [Planctomycetota bacterium]